MWVVELGGDSHMGRGNLGTVSSHMAAHILFGGIDHGSVSNLGKPLR